MRIFIFTLLFGLFIDASEDHRFEDGEQIILWANKVGPYRNPQETYEYYSLPFCKPSETIERSESLGEALSGYELVESNIKVQFKKSTPSQVLCEVKNGLTQAEADLFKHAVANQYWFEFFLDELPIWGLLGDVDEGGDPANPDYFIWTHKNFNIKYNQDRIIEVSLSQEQSFKIKAGEPFTWTYTVQWEQTDAVFEDRFDRYLDNMFFEHQIHWFSIFNSFMMVIFLVGLVAIILLRTLKRDIVRFMKEEEIEDANDIVEESGWKQVHGDVFRTPPYLVIFSALIGIGSQLLVLVFIVIFLSIGFYHNHPFYRRGTIATAFVVVYALTAFVSGYVSGSYYMKNGGKYWLKCCIYTASIFPGVVFSLGFLLNFIALSYGSLAYIPASTMFIMLCLWLLVSFPITFGGTIIGRSVSGKPDNPCRVHPMPKPIPAKRPYQELWVHVILGGILPFGSIFIEMYFVFTAFW
jgi:transmembrane 9 superfamily protein 3